MRWSIAVLKASTVLKRTVVPEHATPNVIVRGARLTGTLQTPSGVRIDGEVEGAVESQGAIVVGASGVVRGDVSASDVIVLGKVTGNVVAANHVEIGPGAAVGGPVTAVSLNIHAGGSYEGQTWVNEDARTESHLLVAGEETVSERRTLPPPFGNAVAPAGEPAASTVPGVSPSPPRSSDVSRPRLSTIDLEPDDAPESESVVRQTMIARKMDGLPSR